MAQPSHQHLKGNRNVGTGHAEFSEERSRRVKAADLGEVEGTHASRLTIRVKTRVNLAFSP